DHVHRRERHRREGDQVPDSTLHGGADQHRADQHDAMDRVRPGHQRGVQGGRHLADHLEADQQAEHEHRDIDEQVLAHRAPPAVPRWALTGWTLTGRTSVATSPLAGLPPTGLAPANWAPHSWVSAATSALTHSPPTSRAPVVTWALTGLTLTGLTLTGSALA